MARSAEVTPEAKAQRIVSELERADMGLVTESQLREAKQAAIETGRTGDRPGQWLSYLRNKGVISLNDLDKVFKRMQDLDTQLGYSK